MVASGLALLGIVVFAILWIVLGNAGVANAPRLFIALLVRAYSSPCWYRPPSSVWWSAATS